jgi:hypothetical protein
MNRVARASDTLSDRIREHCAAMDKFFPEAWSFHMESEQLGRFGHHPVPADDFLVEVECLIGMSENRRLGVDPEPDLEARLRKAMEFRVGGVPECVAGKDQLRMIERRLGGDDRFCIVSGMLLPTRLVVGGSLNG